MPRTNNQLEPWHGALQRRLQARHPTITKFFIHSQKKQAHQEINLIESGSGRDIKKRLKRYDALNRRLRNAIESRANYADPVKYRSALAADLEINVN